MYCPDPAWVRMQHFLFAALRFPPTSPAASLNPVQLNQLQYAMARAEAG